MTDWNAPTPPRGWNSWDCYGTTVTEAEVLANARFMAERLLPLGWDTVVVDIQWHDPAARAGGYNVGAPLLLDGHGRPMPAPNRFPSAAGGAGFAPLAQQVHAFGLRFGVHVMRGVPRLAVERRSPVAGSAVTSADIADLTSTCEWNEDNVGIDHSHPDADAYYTSLLALFAEWGVDFVKADDMLAPYHEAEIASFARAVKCCGRPMTLSLSPGRELSLERAEHVREHATMWRVSDDLWDRWEDVQAQFARMSAWAPYAGPGCWPDADMLPLGHIGTRAERGPDRASRLTREEQRTLMTLWCVSRSPLMMGGDLPTTDEETIALLTNPDILAVNARSEDNRELTRSDLAVVWSAIPTDRDGHYLALFNLADEPREVSVDLQHLELFGSVTARDLWQEDTRTEQGRMARTLPPHGAALLHLWH